MKKRMNITPSDKDKNHSTALKTSENEVKPNETIKLYVKKKIRKHLVSTKNVEILTL